MLDDPLLADFGAHQVLLRVVEVTPTPGRPHAGRLAAVAAAAHDPAARGDSWPAVDEVALLESVVDRYTDRQAADAPKSTAAVRRVIAVLERLRTTSCSGSGRRAARAASPTTSCPRSRTSSATIAARRPGGCLAATPRRGPRAVPGRGRVRDDADAEDSGPPSIGDALGALATPPSTSRRAGRARPGLDETFGSASDALPSLLTVLRPELAPVLYDAWRDLEATPPSQLRIYALRRERRRSGTTRRWTPRGTTRASSPPRGSGRCFATTRRHRAGLLRRALDPRRRVRLAAADGLDRDPVRRGQRGGDRPRGPASERAVHARARPGRAGRRHADGAAAVAVHARLGRDRVRRGGDGVLDDARAHRAPDVVEPGQRPYEPRVRALRRRRLRWPLKPAAALARADRGDAPAAGREPTEEESVVSLDAPRPAIVPGGWIVLERPPGAGSPPRPGLIIARSPACGTLGRDYGSTGRARSSSSTAVARPAGHVHGDPGVRRYAQSEALELLASPSTPCWTPSARRARAGGPLRRPASPGRRLIVDGERTDVTARRGRSAWRRVPGVRAAELVMLGGVRQDFDLTSPRRRPAPRSCWPHRWRTATAATRQVYGNVAQGDPRRDARGGARQRRRDAPRQSFDAEAVAAHPCLRVTPTGRGEHARGAVDGVRWREADSPSTRADRPALCRPPATTSVTSVIFGDGVDGARLPTGRRTSAPSTASGSAPAATSAPGRSGCWPPARAAWARSSTRCARPAAPTARAATRSAATSRWPSRRSTGSSRCSDYADFARTFAGVGKASATRLTDGRRELVHVTDRRRGRHPDRPSPTSTRNLRGSAARVRRPFRRSGSTSASCCALVVAPASRSTPTTAGRTSSRRMRAALLDRFGFDRRELGQDVVRSEVLGAIQGVPGVALRRPRRPRHRRRGPYRRRAHDAVGRRARPASCACASGCARTSRAAGRRGRARPSSSSCSPAAPQTLTLLEIAAMTPSADRLYELLPAVHRLRDADQGQPLQALLRVIAEQVDVVEDDIEQLYDNWFIETCEDWVVPYIGDLVGYAPGSRGRRARRRDARPAPQPGPVPAPRRRATRSPTGAAGARSRCCRSRCADARRLAGAGGRVLRRWSRRAVARAPRRRARPVADLRDGDALDALGGAVRAARAHGRHAAADRRAARPAATTSRAVALFVWRLRSYGVTHAPALQPGGRRAAVLHVQRARQRHPAVRGRAAPAAERPIADELHVPVADQPADCSTRRLDRPLRRRQEHPDLAGAARAGGAADGRRARSARRSCRPRASSSPT